MANNFEPRPLADREYNSFESLGNKRQTARRVTLHGGPVAESIDDLLFELAVLMRAAVLGLTIMTEHDLLEEVQSASE